MKRKHAALLVGVSVTCFAASVIIAINTSDPYGRMLKSVLPEASAERPDTSPFSQEWHEDNARITNDLARKYRWSSEDIKFACLMLQPWPDEPKPLWDVDQVGAEALMLHQFMLAVISDRLRGEVPTDEAVVSAFHANLEASLIHPQDYVREHAISIVMNTGSLSEGRLAKISRMRESDPSESVRRMADIKLRQFEGQPVDLQCPTCPQDGDN